MASVTRWRRHLAALRRKLARELGRRLDQGSLVPGLSSSHLETVMVNELFADAARRLGLRCRDLGGNLLSIEDADRPVFRTCGVYNDLDGFAAGVVCGDKVLSRRYLAEAGLSIPRGESFQWTDERKAVAFAMSLGTPCVAKPARNTSSSAGVSVALAGAAAIRKGFRRAALYSDDILIEEHVEGDDYRLLVYQGRCLSVLLRQRPHVTGNGRDSVAVLIERENSRRIASETWRVGDPELMPLKADRRTRRYLARHGWSLTSVPEAGRRVQLSLLANYGVGASYTECMRSAHPQIVAAAERAAAAVGVVLAGVDVIAADISAPAHVINEINTTPSTQLHYFAANRAERADPFALILRHAVQKRLEASGRDERCDGVLPPRTAPDRRLPIEHRPAHDAATAPTP